MKANILLSCPFLIPAGTKIRITDTSISKTATVFFAGYKVFGRELVRGTVDLFPTFRAVTKNGEMGILPPKDWPANFGMCYLDRCELTVLELPENLGLDADAPNRFSNKVAELVAVCTAEMRDMARRYGITEVDFKRFPSVDAPWATFNDDGGHYAWCPVEKILFKEDEGLVVIWGNDHGTVWEGYLDDTYGDYFDVGHSFGAVYRAFVETLNRRQS